MPSVASREFALAVGYVDQLIAIHRKLQTGRGRRYEQDAIHRAGIVMMIAAWESYVEKVALEGLDAIERSAGIAAGGPQAVAAAGPPPWVKHAFGLRRTDIKNSIKRFNTPNAVNVRDLFEQVLEFSPWAHWSWHIRRRQWNQEEMRRRLNHWMDIRHSVAHGFPLPADIPWLQDARGRPRLTLDLLKECKDLFLRLVVQTDTAFSVFLRDHHGIQLPW